MPLKPSKSHVRGILSVEPKADSKDRFCPHWAPACQVVAHVCVALRKALIHFYLTFRSGPKDKMTESWQFLIQLGKLLQALVTQAGDDDPPPVDPTDLYRALEAVVANNHRNPHNANFAVRYLLLTIQSCTQALPSASYASLWRNMLDLSGLGLVTKCIIVGKRFDCDDDFITQRTKKETMIQWCPLPLRGKMDSVQQGLEKLLLRRQVVPRWDPKNYDFEVKVPAGWSSSKSGKNAQSSSKPSSDDADADGDGSVSVANATDDGDQTSSIVSGKTQSDAKSTADTATTASGKTKPENAWEATKTQPFHSLPDHLFLALQRFDNEPADGDGATPKKQDEAPKLLNESIQIPVQLDMTKFATTECKKAIFKNGLKYNLVGGILCDEDDFVAILKTQTVEKSSAGASTTKSENNDDDDDSSDKDEPNEWSLLESEEIIPMKTSDVVEFLQGDGEELCGTVLVYTREVIDPRTQQLLSDIIISHVSGHMNHASDYYEEEIIEEEIIEE